MQQMPRWADCCIDNSREREQGQGSNTNENKNRVNENKGAHADERVQTSGPPCDRAAGDKDLTVQLSTSSQACALTSEQ
jgi:hypothetical protein